MSQIFIRRMENRVAYSNAPRFVLLLVCLLRYAKEKKKLSNNIINLQPPHVLVYPIDNRIYWQLDAVYIFDI